MIDDKDIQKLKKELATKEDLEKFSVRAFDTFATKDDLEKFATKDDLEKFSVQAFDTFATKDDLEKFSVQAFDTFATKDDLKEAVANLATKEDFNNLLTAVDAYAKKADTFFQEMVMLAHKVERHEKWLLQIADKLNIKLEY